MIIILPFVLGIAAWCIHRYAQTRHEERRLSDGARTACMFAFMACVGFAVLIGLNIAIVLIGGAA